MDRDIDRNTCTDTCIDLADMTLATKELKTTKQFCQL